MTRYSLSSDSHVWWVPSSIAGAVGLATVTAVLVVPAIAQARPVETTPYEAPAVGPTSFVVERPCFLHRSRWNVALDSPQPVCTTTIGTAPVAGTRAPAHTAPVVLRPWLDARP